MTLSGSPRRKKASASRPARTSPACKSAMLMQNHGFLASINGIVSCAQLYRIPLLMLISHRGDFGERDPWQTEGGGVTEHLLRALRIPFIAARSSRPRRATRSPRPDAGRVCASAGRRAAASRSDVGGARADGDAHGSTRLNGALYSRDHPQRRPRRRHDHGRRGGGAAVDRPPAELLLPAACDGTGVVDGARHRAGAAGEAGGGLRRRRIGAHEPRRPDDAGAVPAAEPGPRRLRQREPAVGRRLPDRDVHRQRSRRHRGSGGRAAHARRCATLDEFTQRVQRRARRRRPDDDRGQGRGRRARRATSPTSRCSRTGISFRGT